MRTVLAAVVLATLACGPAPEGRHALPPLPDDCTGGCGSWMGCSTTTPEGAGNLEAGRRVAWCEHLWPQDGTCAVPVCDVQWASREDRPPPHDWGCGLDAPVYTVEVCPGVLFTAKGHALSTAPMRPWKASMGSPCDAWRVYGDDAERWPIYF